MAYDPYASVASLLAQFDIRLTAAEAGNTPAPTPTPTPAPTFAPQPSVSPSSGTAGTTTFTATPGTVNNGSVTSRAWLLNGTSISTALTAAPQAAGTLTYQEFATGPGGSASSAIQSVTVAAAGGPFVFAAPNTAIQDGDSRTDNTGARAVGTTLVLSSGGGSWASIALLQSYLGNPYLLQEGYQHAIGAATSEAMIGREATTSMALTGNPAGGTASGGLNDAVLNRDSDGLYTPVNHPGNLTVSAGMVVNDKANFFDVAQVSGHANGVGVRSMENVGGYVSRQRAAGKAVLTSNEYPLGVAALEMEAKAVSGGTVTALYTANFVDGEAYNAPGVIGKFATGGTKRLTKVGSAPGQDQYTVSSSGVYVFGGTAPTDVWLNYSAYRSNQQDTTDKLRVMNEWSNSNAANFTSAISGTTYGLPGLKASDNVIVADTWNALLDTASGTLRRSLPGCLDPLQLHHVLLGSLKAVKAYKTAWDAKYPGVTSKAPLPTRNNWYVARGSGGTTAYSGTLPPSMRAAVPTLVTKNGVPIGRIDTGTGAITAGNGSTDIVSGTLNFSTGAWTITTLNNAAFANGAIIWFEQDLGNYDVANFVEGTIGRNALMNGLLDMTPASGTNLPTTTGALPTAIGSFTAAQVPYGWSLAGAGLAAAITAGTGTAAISSGTTTDGFPKWTIEVDGVHTASMGVTLAATVANTTARINAGDRLMGGNRQIIENHSTTGSLFGAGSGGVAAVQTAGVSRTGSGGAVTATILNTRWTFGQTSIFLNGSLLAENGGPIDLPWVTPLLDTSGATFASTSYTPSLLSANNVPISARMSIAQAQLRRRNDVAA